MNCMIDITRCLLTLRWPNTVCTRFTSSVSDAIECLLGLWYANTASIKQSLNFIPNIIITKLSFVLKITQFLVYEPFFFYHQRKKVSSRRTKHFCMLFNFAVKTQLKSMHTHLTKKLRLLFLVEMTCFLRNRSLEFREI